MADAEHYHSFRFGFQTEPDPPNTHSEPPFVVPGAYPSDISVASGNILVRAFEDPATDIQVKRPDVAGGMRGK